MIYLSAEELVQNIAYQSERASAVIEHTDFSDTKFNPNAVITSFLGNIFDSALIVTALEKCSGLGDCHRHAADLVAISPKISKNVKDFVSQINRIRQKYSLDGGSSQFDPKECLDFLNAYDCFMFDFLKNSETVQKMASEGKAEIRFSSMRNMVEKLLKKSELIQPNAPKTAESSDTAQLLQRNNELLEKLLGELTKINERLDRIEKKIL